MQGLALLGDSPCLVLLGILLFPLRVMTICAKYARFLCVPTKNAVKAFIVMKNEQDRVFRA